MTKTPTFLRRCSISILIVLSPFALLWVAGYLLIVKLLYLLVQLAMHKLLMQRFVSKWWLCCSIQECWRWSPHFFVASSAHHFIISSYKWLIWFHDYLGVALGAYRVCFHQRCTLHGVFSFPRPLGFRGSLISGSPANTDSCGWMRAWRFFLVPTMVHHYRRWLRVWSWWFGTPTIYLRGLLLLVLLDTTCF